MMTTMMSFRLPLVVLLVVAAAVAHTAAAAANEESVTAIEITDTETFQELMRGDTPSFVKFYAPWCGHCKRLAPTWNSLAREMRSNPNIIVAQVDCTQLDAVCLEQGVRGYPTLRFYAGDGDKGMTYTEGRSLEALVQYVEEQLSELVDDAHNTMYDSGATNTFDDSDPQVTPEGLLMLEHAAQLTRLLRQDEAPVFVMFMTSWCAHCRAAKPAVLQLAQHISLQQRHDEPLPILIAMVNCGDYPTFCRSENVRGYPTFKLYRPHATTVAYEGSRTTEAMLAFINKHLVESVSQTEAPAPVFEPSEDGLIFTAGSYHKGVAVSPIVVVKAFVPWCAHSQRMAPAWREIVDQFKGEERITFAQLDCSKYPATCQQTNVKGYPQITAYKGGRKFQVFHGRRTAEEMGAFVSRLLSSSTPTATRRKHKDEL